MKALIEKFLTDTLTTQELDTLYAWLQHPMHQRLFKTYVRDHYDLNISLSKVRLNDAYHEVWKKIHRQRQQKPERKSVSRRFKYAALFIGLIGASYVIYLLWNYSSLSHFMPDIPQVTLLLDDGSLYVLDENKQTTIDLKHDRVVVKQEYGKLLYEENAKAGTIPTYNQLTVPYGKRFEISLSDGTSVLLNAGTKLRYPTAFTTLKSREVFLDGEAYFDVKSIKNQPFIVHAQKMNIRVIGTKFNVSSYDDENNTAVVLVEGNVVVAPNIDKTTASRSIHLKPAQQALLQNGKLSVNQVSVEKHTAWIDGKLFFINDRFENIIQELERHYNVKIINTYEALNNTKYTGTFKENTLEQVLATFKANTLFDYKIMGQTIIITSKEKEDI